MDCYYKLRQLFYYKVRLGLLQIATGITKYDDYYSIQLGKQDQKIFSLTATMNKENVLKIVWIKFLPLSLNYIRELKNWRF